MSQFLEELMTEPIGFIIAMVILIAGTVGGLYGYWTYTNHVTLENYLWPIAEVVPLKNGTYYLAIVNTGYEPFTIKQIYLSNGSTISVNTKPLSHGQWFAENLTSLPTAVKVCSAVEPGICIVAPVHGWSMAVIKPPPHAVLAVVIDSCTFNLTKLNLTKTEEDLVLQAFHYSTHCNCTTHNNLTTCTCPWRLVWYGWSGGSVCYGGNLTFLIQPTHGEVRFIKYALEGPNETKPNTIVIFNTDCTYWLHRLENLTKLPQTLLQQYALWGQLYSGPDQPLLQCPS